MAGNVRRLLQVLFWVMLNVTFIGCQNALITANQRILMEKQSLTLTCKYNGSGTETVVLWYNETVGNFLALKPNASISGTCNFLSNGPSFEAARVTYSCDSTSDIYTLTITEVHLEDAGLWSCTFQDPLTGSPAADINIEIQTATTSFRSTSTNALCNPDGPLFVILDICIIISYIIVVILIIDLIFWNKNLTFPIFKPFVKRGHRYLRILYLVLLITVVVCEISIIIMIIIGRQCEKILIVGLCLGLIIITVSCIFLIVFIKTEVIIRRKDALRNPKTNTDVTITVSLRQIFISNFEWIGPKGNTLNTEVNTEEKHIIVEHNSDTGETSLTIKNVSQEDNGSYFCQAKNGFKIAKDSIHILCGDIENRTRNMGSSAAVSREHVQFHMERKGVKSDDEERPPAIHRGTQNKVESKRPQPLPPVGGVVENKPRSQPPRPGNIDAKDRNQRGLSANYDDTQGLPTGTPRPNRLIPLTPKQATVQEEDAPEEPKKKKKKKKMKGQMNEENQEEEMEELRNQRTLSEDN